MSISAIYLNESLLGAGRDQCVGIDALALKLSKSFILSSVASEGFSVLITVPCRKQVLERVMTLDRCFANTEMLLKIPCRDAGRCKAS